MSAQGLDNRLADRLADLFPYAEDVVNLARRAGLDTDQIRLTGAVTNQMGEVVRYARAHGSVGSLIAAALQLAPGDAELEQLNQEAARPGVPRRRREGADAVSPETIGQDVADVLRGQGRQLNDLDKRTAVIETNVGHIREDLAKLIAQVAEVGISAANHPLPPDYMLMRTVLMINVIATVALAIWMALHH